MKTSSRLPSTVKYCAKVFLLTTLLALSGVFVGRTVFAVECPTVTVETSVYHLEPCSIAAEMVDGAGDKPFQVTLVQEGMSRVYGFSVYGYGNGFPTYAIIGSSSGGVQTPRWTLNESFQDSVLNSENGQAKVYTGYLPIWIYHGSWNGVYQELKLDINLTVNPALQTGMPDLTITDVQILGTPRLGDGFINGYVFVKNQGTAQAVFQASASSDGLPNIYVVAVAANGQVDDGGTKVAMSGPASGGNQGSTLQPGETKQYSFSTYQDVVTKRMILGSRGERALFFKVDPDNEVAELHEGNNNTSKIITIQAAMNATPLSCGALEADSDANKYFGVCRSEGYAYACFNKYSGAFQGCGKTLGEGCTYSNTNADENISCKAEGTASPKPDLIIESISDPMPNTITGGWDIAVYFNQSWPSGTTFHNFDVELKNLTTGKTMSSTVGSSVARNIDFSIDWAPGTYQVQAKVDSFSLNQVDESNENNNVATKTLTVKPVGSYTGDGTYELTTNERVKLNNGVTVKVATILTDVVGYKVAFDMIDASGKNVKTTGYLTASLQPYVFDASGVIITVSSVGYNGARNAVKATLASTGAVPLSISNVTLTDITANLARFTWQTNKPASGFVYYRVGASNSYSWQGYDELKTGHSVMLPSLSPATAYYYYVNAKDAAGNIARTNESSFVTLRNTDEAGKPDLTVQNFKYSPVATDQGHTVQVEFDLVNIGQVQIADDFKLLVVNETMGTGLKEEMYSRLYFTPNDYRAHVIIMGKIGENFAEGENKIKIAVDFTNSIEESNESNNVIYKFVYASRAGAGNVKGAKQTTSGRLAKISWQTDGRYNCSVVFKGRPDIGDDTLGAGAGISVAYGGEQTSVDVDLGALNLPNRESDRVVYYKIVCRDRNDGHKVTESGVYKIELPTALIPRPSVTTSGAPVQSDPDESSNAEVVALRERIKRLELRISELEKEVVTRERQLTTRINQALTERLKGKILLQVEGKGEAWYVDPITQERFYLKDGQSAYSALQAFGLGISNANLEKIPVGLEERAEKIDADNDGLDDRLEEALGTDKNNPDTDGDGFKDGEEVKGGFNPRGTGRMALNKALAGNLGGRIVLQVEDRGQAWYIHDGKRYYLKDGAQAYQIMRFLSLGITNENIRKIGVGEFE